MAQPEIIQEILRGVQLNEESLRKQLVFDEALGFLALQGGDTEVTSVAGFYTPTVGGNFRVPHNLHVPASIEDVPEADRTIDELGKGIGVRLYNTPQATAGRKQKPSFIGMYSFEVSGDKIMDTRNGSEGSIANSTMKIASHAQRIIASKKHGLTEVVDEIEASYSDAEAVLIGQPPRAMIRQRMRLISNPVRPAFMVVRKPGLELPRIGHRLSPTRYK